MTWHEINRKRKKEGKNERKNVRKKVKHFIAFYLKVNFTHIQYLCSLGDIVKIYFAPKDNCSWVQICYSEYKIDIKDTLVSFLYQARSD